MAVVTLDKGKNPKAVVNVDNSLNYQDKEGNLQSKQIKTAITEIAEEAGKVTAMGFGAVTMSVKDSEGAYKNYFVNRNENNGTITLVPTDLQDKTDSSQNVYFNRHSKENNGKNYFFYTLNDKSEAGKAFLENLSTTEWQDKDGANRSNLEARVVLHNPELVKQLKEKGENALAVVSKDNFRITTKEEHFKAKDSTQEKKQEAHLDRELC